MILKDFALSEVSIIAQLDETRISEVFHRSQKLASKGSQAVRNRRDLGNSLYFPAADKKCHVDCHF